MTKLQEVVMFKDRMMVWVLEYVLGGTLVLVPLTVLGLWRPEWTDASIWAAQLFVVCLGVVLISCASSMRQRMFLAKRIDILAEQIRDHCASSQESTAIEDQND